MTSAERRALALVMAVAGYGVALVRGPALLLDGDTYWHIATGNWILRHWAVPHQDPFSFTAAGTPWLDHEWLSELLMSLAYHAAGWHGLILLAAFALGLALGLLSWRLCAWLALVPTAALTLLALGTAMPGLLCRPHLIALPLLVSWSGALIEARVRGRPPWIALPLMTLWANMHGSFLAGLALTLPIAAEAVLAAPGGQRRRTALAWAGFTAAALFAACLTPNGVPGLVRPFQVLAMPHMMGAIPEWQSPDFQSLQPLEVWFAVALAVTLVQGIRLPVSRIIVLLALLHAGLQHARNQILLGFIGPLVLAEPLARQFLRRATRAPATDARAGGIATGAAAVALVLTPLSLARPVVRADDAVTPSTALAHVPPALTALPVLNAYSFGGYLIFRGIRPFIDGRADMYGERFFTDYLALLAPRGRALETALRHYSIAWTLLKPGDGAVAVLDVLPGWRRLYADQRAVVFVRTRWRAPHGIAER